MQFKDLRLAEPILRAIREDGYTTATPIQARAIPHALEGKDVLGCAQTGTGKTAAFALPTLNTLANQPVPKGVRLPRCLVLSPTRELAAQIGESFQSYGKHLQLRGAVIFGGVNQNPQVKKLRAGVDILVATPGRLMDLMNQGHVNLSQVKTLVLDEADRMLDMGFINDIRKITAKVPKKRQTLLFSATMPKAIRGLANDLLKNPVNIEVAAVSAPAERIKQCVYYVDKPHKPAMLARIKNNPDLVPTLDEVKHDIEAYIAAYNKSAVHQKDDLVDDHGRHGGLPKNAAFVIAGDLNSDPSAGDSRREAIRSLLEHSRVNDPRPTSERGLAIAKSTQEPQVALHTASFGEDRTMRIDYVLPSQNLKVVDSGVFWPSGTEVQVDASDHRMVWIELEIAE